jgi:hypothetical protein
VKIYREPDSSHFFNHITALKRDAYFVLLRANAQESDYIADFGIEK